MAFVDPNEQQQPGSVVPAADQQAPQSTGGAGVGGSSKAASTPGQNVPAQPSAQLSAYLAANQPQSQSFAGNVANTLSNQTQAAGNAILPAVNTYTGQLYSVPTNAEVNNIVATHPSDIYNVPASPAPAPVDASGNFVRGNKYTTPQNFAPPVDKSSIFADELGAAAKAPNPADTFETTAPYAGIVGNIQKAVEQANLWNSGNNVSSLSTALTPFEGANATTGDKTLDSLLLSQTTGAYGKIKTAVAPAAALPGQLAAGSTAANKALQDAIAADNAATPAAQAAANTYATNLTKYLNDTLATNQSTVNSQEASNATLSTDLASGNLTAADAQAMGIPADKAADFAASYNKLNPTISAENALAQNMTRAIGPSGLKNIDLSSYLTNGTAPTLNLSTVASSKDYADIAALNKLVGSGGPALPIDSSTAALAGTGLNPNASSTFNSTGAYGQLNPLLTQALKFQSELAHDAAIDPPQTGEQAAVINQANKNIKNIIDYLRAMTGVTAPPPTPGGHFSPNV